MTKIQHSNPSFQTTFTPHNIQFYHNGNKNMLQQKALELSISQYISQQNLVFLLFRGMINAGSLLSFNCVLCYLFILLTQVVQYH